MSEADAAFMTQALRLAKAQMGRTWPNPPVGCVLVKDGKIVGEGATGDGGRPHAEEVALQDAGDAARGATAYVTLEPCGERSTGAASCGQRLVDAGVARVVYACTDPSPFASHKGPARLKAANIQVETGLMQGDAGHLIAGFVRFVETGLPLVTESQTAASFDAEFTAADDSDLEAELRAWGAKGYRSLFVQPNSELARRMREAGLTAKS